MDRQRDGGTPYRATNACRGVSADRKPHRAATPATGSAVDASRCAAPSTRARRTNRPGVDLFFGVADRLPAEVTAPVREALVRSLDAG